MKASTARVAEVNAPAVERYKEMRDLLRERPGLDPMLCEILITTQLALLGHETAFKMHALRLFDLKVTKERLEDLVLVGLGVTFVIPHAARVLDWVAEAHEVYKTHGKLA